MVTVSLVLVVDAKDNNGNRRVAEFGLMFLS